MKKCTECNNYKTEFLLQIISTGKKGNFPLWVPQIKERCAICYKYIRFAPQSSILIKRFNNSLLAVTLPATGKDFYEN